MFPTNGFRQDHSRWVLMLYFVKLPYLLFFLPFLQSVGTFFNAQFFFDKRLYLFSVTDASHAFQRARTYG